MDEYEQYPSDMRRRERGRPRNQRDVCAGTSLVPALDPAEKGFDLLFHNDHS